MALSVAAIGGLAGCATAQPSPGARQGLNDGYAALERGNYDAASAAAEAYLRTHRNGPGVAEALYLKGRAFEQRTPRDQAVRDANLAQARSAYAEALNHQPEPKLEGNIRAGLANVAYFRDDYLAALGQWTAAYDKLTDADAKAWTLYRIGLCQQRLGRFDRADQTFEQVKRNYPSTEPAKRAADRQGTRSFTLQLATYGSAPVADAATQQLRQQNLTPTRVTDPQGRIVLTLPNLPAYDEAKRLKQRLAGQFPDAVIVP
ncbi:MAG TPA: tetratricopeptide repeat protein [Tepidisphaeraceae bacterium]|nr:tetratricopeptide repeat protein [Tepidisphaeraceae bacterium]